MQTAAIASVADSIPPLEPAAFDGVLVRPYEPGDSATRQFSDRPGYGAEPDRNTPRQFRS